MHSELLNPEMMSSELAKHFREKAAHIGPDGFQPVFRDEFEEWAKTLEAKHRTATEFVHLLRHAVTMSALFSDCSVNADNAWAKVLKYLE
jgi:hypothetical protein